LQILTKKKPNSPRFTQTNGLLVVVGVYHARLFDEILQAPHNKTMGHISDDGPPELANFNHMRQAVIDTSALIVLQKLEILELLAQALKLKTIAEVKAEFGSELPVAISLLDDFPPHGLPADYQRLITDRKLVAQAIARRHPLIAEDRRILKAGDEAGLPVYVTLVMVVFLVYRQMLDQSGYDHCRRRLATEYNYAPAVLHYADDLMLALEKYGCP